MRNLRKIGAILVVIAMICSLQAVAFAAADGNVLNGEGNNSEIQIKSAVATVANGIYNVTLTFDFANTVTVTEGTTQVTVLGFVFGTVADGTEAEDVAAPVAGDIRAIEQTALATKGANGYTATIKFAKGTGAYQVAEDEVLVVKMGTDAAVTKAQAFFIDLSNAAECYAVTFAAGEGATGTMASVDGSKNYTLPACGFTHATKIFAGWKIGNTNEVKQAGETITLSADTTLTATWRDKAVYTITYHRGTNGAGSMTAGSVTEGESLTLPQNGFTADGDYKFVGWSVDSASGVKQPGDIVPITANTSVIALWEALATYTITFANGTYGDGLVPEGSIAAGTAVEGKQFTVPAIDGITVPEGYKFTGWKIDGTETILVAGAKHTFTENATLVAQWAEDTGILGDADGNEQVNLRDILAIQKHMKGSDPLSADAQALADVDGNGQVNLRDILAIQKYMKGTGNDFGIGQ